MLEPQKTLASYITAYFLSNDCLQIQFYIYFKLPKALLESFLYSLHSFIFIHIFILSDTLNSFLCTLVSISFCQKSFFYISFNSLPQPSPLLLSPLHPLHSRPSSLLALFPLLSVACISPDLTWEIHLPFVFSMDLDFCCWYIFYEFFWISTPMPYSRIVISPGNSSLTLLNSPFTQLLRGSEII